MLRSNGFLHDGSLPSLCHQYQNGNLQNVDKFQTLADKVNLSGPVSDLGTFANDYLEVFSRGYNYAFGIAAAAMVISLLVYLVFNRHLPAKHIEDKKQAESKTAVRMPWSEEKPRLISLGLVFIVVIFFWMSFHQNGLTLTMFARDYTVKAVGAFTYLFFDLYQIIAFVGAIVGLVLLFNKKLKSLWKMVGAAMFVGLGYLTYYFYTQNDPASNPIEPEIFQSYNPLFIVTLTFLVMGIFSWLNKRGLEPSTPRKIGIGMIIASLGFVIILVGSLGLQSPIDLGGEPVLDDGRVSPYWLMSSYLVLTIAELFLSPMGLSFVSKVSPPRFQGLMQGGWLLATALGNKLLFVGSYMWDRIPLWSLWLIFVICCLVSAAFIFSIMKRLERVTGDA
jgi:POT family proton-dependent oligopeptide transporter